MYTQSLASIDYNFAISNNMLFSFLNGHLQVRSDWVQIPELWCVQEVGYSPELHDLIHKSCPMRRAHERSGWSLVTHATTLRHEWQLIGWWASMGSTLLLRELLSLKPHPIFTIILSLTLFSIVSNSLLKSKSFIRPFKQSPLNTQHNKL